MRRTYSDFVLSIDLALVSKKTVDGNGQLDDFLAGDALFDVLAADAAHHSGDSQQADGRFGDGFNHGLFFFFFFFFFRNKVSLIKYHQAFNCCTR